MITILSGLVVNLLTELGKRIGLNGFQMAAALSIIAGMVYVIVNWYNPDIVEKATIFVGMVRSVSQGIYATYAKIVSMNK